MLLFVYGTLLRGEENHGELRGARFVREALTEARYELVDMGGYPALLEGGSCAVAGELYEITGELQRALDLFEEVPDLYERRAIRLVTHEGALHADTYLMRRELAANAPRIASGDWRKR